MGWRSGICGNLGPSGSHRSRAMSRRNELGDLCQGARRIGAIRQRQCGALGNVRAGRLCACVRWCVSRGAHRRNAARLGNARDQSASRIEGRGMRALPRLYVPGLASARADAIAMSAVPKRAAPKQVQVGRLQRFQAEFAVSRTNLPGAGAIPATLPFTSPRLVGGVAHEIGQASGTMHQREQDGMKAPNCAPNWPICSDAENGKSVGGSIGWGTRIRT